MQALHHSTCTALSIADAHARQPSSHSLSPLHAPALATSCVLVQHYSRTYAYCLLAGQLWCCLLHGIIWRDEDPIRAPAQWRRLRLATPARQLAVIRYNGYSYLLYLEDGGRVVLLRDAVRGDTLDEPHVTPHYLSDLAGPVASLYNAKDGALVNVALLYESGRMGLLTWPWGAITPVDHLIGMRSLVIPEPVHAVAIHAHQHTVTMAVGRSRRLYYLRAQQDQSKTTLYAVPGSGAFTGISLSHRGRAGRADAVWVRQVDGHWWRSPEGLLRGVPAYSWLVHAPAATFLVSPAGRLFAHDGTRVRAVSWSWQCRESAWLWKRWSLPRRRPCADGRFAIASLTVWHGMNHRHGSHDDWCNAECYLVLQTRCGHLVEALVCPVTGDGEIRRVVPVPGRGWDRASFTDKL